jgi:hypothetical protein
LCRHQGAERPEGKTGADEFGVSWSSRAAGAHPPVPTSDRLDGCDTDRSNGDSQLEASHPQVHHCDDGESTAKDQQ